MNKLTEEFYKYFKEGKIDKFNKIRTRKLLILKKVEE